MNLYRFILLLLSSLPSQAFKQTQIMYSLKKLTKFTLSSLFYYYVFAFLNTDPIANCSTSIFNDCSNRGVCTMKGCECYPGYAGVDCSGVLEKDCKNDCSGHGKCRTADATCVCDVGYDGDDCAVGQCVNDCSGHGTCMTEPQLYCQCFFGYVGMDCNAKICPNDCSGHGYCGSDGNCTCLPGYSGYDCSTGACRDNCNEHGVCVDSRCECNLGKRTSCNGCS